ncbi:nuclear transport factor 2 family protein [Micromonospora sp. NPDC018662]|uniref:nuclear transport factor 2 family protein n=1 Tax=Micromonospora sp. NPDC018662 TaxID=3364238 RepID=UPI00378EC9C2
MHPGILTDDIDWAVHGHRNIRGRAEFDGEIENRPSTGSPQLDVERVIKDGPVVVGTGEGRGVSVAHGPFRFAFNDLFTLRDGLIARVDSPTSCRCPGGSREGGIAVSRHRLLLNPAGGRGAAGRLHELIPASPSPDGSVPPAPDSSAS